LKKRNNYYFILASLLLLLTGCEGLTSYEKIVTNRSEDTLYVYVLSKHKIEAEYRDTIAPGTSGLVYYTEDRGGNRSPQPCLFHLDSIHIKTSKGNPLMKNPMDEQNWDLSITSKRISLVDQVCSFIVTNEDITSDQ